MEKIVEKTGRFSTKKNEGCFSTGKFLVFHTKRGEISAFQRLELMLVLISLTVSAKAASFFIFFSTCWME